MDNRPNSSQDIKENFSTQIPYIHQPQKRDLDCVFYRKDQENYITFILSASDNELDWLPTQLGARPTCWQDTSQTNTIQCSPSHAEQLNPNSSLPKLLNAILDKADPQDLCFERSPIERKITEENNAHPKMMIAHTSISYRLPKSPWALLFWLASLLTHIHTQRKIAEKKKSGTEIKSLNGFLKYFFKKLDDLINQPQPVNAQHAVSLLKKIRELKKNQDALSVKTKLHLWIYLCDLDNQLIVHYFSDNITFKVHPDISIFSLSKTDWNQNIKTLTHAISDLTQSQREKYIPLLMRQFIHIHNQVILIDLYQNLLRKTSQSGRVFNWNTREADFFLHLEFAIQDDRLHFVNLENNPGYQRHYAKGKSGYQNFFKEMDDLIQALGLQLTPNSDGHKLLSLSLSSTQTLLKTWAQFKVFHHDDSCELSLHNVADLEQWITQLQAPQLHQNSSASQNNLFFSNNSSSSSSTEASELLHSLSGNQMKSIHYFFKTLNELNSIVSRLGSLYKKLSEEEAQFNPGLFQKNEATACMLKFGPLAKHVLRMTANTNKIISENNHENHIELNQTKIDALIQKAKSISVKFDDILKLFHPTSTYFNLLSYLKIQLELALENIEWHSKKFPLTKSIAHSEFTTTLFEHIETILKYFKDKHVCALIDRQFELIKKTQSHTRTQINKFVNELENTKCPSAKNQKSDLTTSTSEEEIGNSGSQSYKKSS